MGRRGQRQTPGTLILDQILILNQILRRPSKAIDGIRKPILPRKLQAMRVDIQGYDLGRVLRSRERAGEQADRAYAEDEYGLV